MAWTQDQIKREVAKLVTKAAQSLTRRDAALRIAADAGRPEYERVAAKQAAAHFDEHRAACLKQADALEAGQDPKSLGY